MSRMASRANLRETLYVSLSGGDLTAVAHLSVASMSLGSALRTSRRWGP